MLDLHTHILPGVDDGPHSMEEAVEMGRQAWQGGTKAVVATPHQDAVPPGHSPALFLQERLVCLQKALQAAGIALRVLPGMENPLTPDTAQRARSGQALPIHQGPYTLVELPFVGYPTYTEEALFRLQVAGFKPIIAHPERNSEIQNRPELLLLLAQRGVLAQITAGSLLGKFGASARKSATRLLQENLIHLIASDAHSPRGGRAPDLTEGVAAAARIIGPERARAMVEDTPAAVLAGQEVQVPAPGQPARRWWLPWR